MQQQKVFNKYEIPERYVPSPYEMVGGYQILSEIGQGTFGIVYKVSELSSKRIFALKLLKLWAITYEEERKMILQRFQMEYETGKISSPHLVQTKGIGKEKGNPYIIMEFCSKGDLRNKMSRRLSLDFVSTISSDILTGLKHLHENGKIHRDLKPDNVLLDEFGTARLTDFGIAGHKNIRMTKKNLFGVPQEIFGTYAYMPPEQLKPRDATKLPTTDIFSFGVIAFEMLTKRLPFGPLKHETDLAEYVMRVNAAKWEDIRNYRNDVSELWVEIINRCLEPDYRNRFQSVDEILDQLGRPSVKEKRNAGNKSLALKVMQGEEYGRVYQITGRVNNSKDYKLTIGRDAPEDKIKNDLQVLEIPSDRKKYFISRRHATLERHAGDNSWVIRDGQWIKGKVDWALSLNGTYVNSQKVGKKGCKIRIGDIITIGDTTLKAVGVAKK